LRITDHAAERGALIFLFAKVWHSKVMNAESNEPSEQNEIASEATNDSTPAQGLAQERGMNQRFVQSPTGSEQDSLPRSKRLNQSPSDRKPRRVKSTLP
jgi:hypothetical protein